MKKALIYVTIGCLVLGIYIVKANVVNENIQRIFQKAEHGKQSDLTKVKSISNKIEEQDSQPEGNYISAGNVSISIHKDRSFKLLNITPSKTLAALGTPISKNSKYSPDYDGEVLTYNYGSVKIYFLNNTLLGVDIKDEGAYVDIELANGKILSKCIGAKGDDLNKIFSASWANRKNNNIIVWIKTPGGIQTDASIVFTLSQQDPSLTSGNFVNSISIIN